MFPFVGVCGLKHLLLLSPSPFPQTFSCLGRYWLLGALWAVISTKGIISKQGMISSDSELHETPCTVSMQIGSESVPHRPFLCQTFKVWLWMQKRDTFGRLHNGLWGIWLSYLMHVAVWGGSLSQLAGLDAGWTVSRLSAVFAVGYRDSSHCYSRVKKKTPPAHSPQFPFTILTTPPPINTPSHQHPPASPIRTADAVTGAMMMIWDFACSSDQRR